MPAIQVLRITIHEEYLTRRYVMLHRFKNTRASVLMRMEVSNLGKRKMGLPMTVNKVHSILPVTLQIGRYST